MADAQEARKEPNFGDAPRSLSTGGKISGPLKGKTRGYRGLSKRARAMAVGGIGLLVMLIVLGITAMPDPAETSARLKAKQEQKDADDSAEKDGPKSTVPARVMDAGNGVSAPRADATLAAGTAGQGQGQGQGRAKDSTTRHEVPGIGNGKADPLAGTGGRQAGADAGGQSNGQQQLTPDEQKAQRAALEREQALKAARDSEMRDSSQQLAQPQSNAGANAIEAGTRLVPPIPGAANGPAPNYQAMNSPDDPNKQLRKEAFLAGQVGQASAVPSTYLATTVQKPRSPYQIEAGWLIPAMMDSMMVSDLPGTLRAHVSQNVMDSATGRFVLIPGGARLVGHYDSQIAFGQSRVLVVWDLIKFPDGSELSISGMPGVDQVGAAGLTGDVDNHMWTVLKAAIFMSVITAGAQLSQPQASQSNGGYQAPSASQTMSAQLGQQLGQVSSNMINKYLNIQPTISAIPGTRFNVLAKQNMVFDKPWDW
jgi:type IV secretion system protein VirB10